MGGHTTAIDGKKLISWGVGILVVVPALLLLVAAGILHERLSSTGTYREAVQVALLSPEIQAALGNGIHVRSTAFGFTYKAYGSEFTEFAVTLAGSQGSGRLYGVGNTTAGLSEYSRLTFVPNKSGSQAIDLTPTPRRLGLPSVSSKKVYLVPLGLDADEKLEWAPAYYKAKFGIEVEILPAVAITRELVNVQRRQVNSEKCVEHLRKLHPELAQDPSAVLIGVTSEDIYIPSFNWRFAENYREGARFAIVSSARLRPFSILASLNPEWLRSRLVKMLTKNIGILYFDLPMSSDYTSLMSGGVASGTEVDLMGPTIIGAEGRWDAFIETDDPGTTIYAIPNKPPLWRLTYSGETFPQSAAHVFTADLALGLFMDRTVDFRFEGDSPLQFTRVYRNQDDRSRAFGIGTLDTLDIFIVGQMGVYIDLIDENGGRVHFTHTRTEPGHPGDTYVESYASAGSFPPSTAIFYSNVWTVTQHDGSKLYFPHRPKALEGNVTVLTGYTDSTGHKYEMERDSWGSLLSVTTPSGQWLHFEPDAQHRIHRITASSGRVVTYEYDDGGRLSHVADSEGNEESYVYDDKSQMLTVTRGSGKPLITNEYDVSGNIIGQRMEDGQSFRYHYTRDPQGRGNALVPDLITDPNGLLTHFQYNSEGYAQSLPTYPPH
jgi:YD repeat-containing protein